MAPQAATSALLVAGLSQWVRIAWNRWQDGVYAVWCGVAPMQLPSILVCMWFVVCFACGVALPRLPCVCVVVCHFLGLRACGEKFVL